MTSDLPPATSPETEPQGPSNLRLRVIWGLLAAAVLFGCTFAGPLTFGLFFAFVQAVMLKEYYRIMRAGGYQATGWLGLTISLLVFGVLFYSAAYFPPLPTTTVVVPGWHTIGSGSTLAMVLLTGYLLALVIGVATTLVLIRAISQWPASSRPFGSRFPLVAGVCYVSVAMGLLNVIAFQNGQFTPRHVFLLIFLIWASDTGAYIVGKTLGKHKLAPAISPGKTWEGFLGGVLLTLAVGWAAGYFVPDVPLGHRLVAAGVVAVFGPLGDLAESMLKRSAGVKDSGTFLPGHGGLLDRFDAFLLVLPVLALLQALAG